MSKSKTSFERGRAGSTSLGLDAGRPYWRKDWSCIFFFFWTRLKLHLAMHTINGLSSAQQSFHNPVNRVARLDPSPFSALHPPVPWPLHGLHACISMAMALGPVLDHKCLLRASFAVTRALRPGAYTSPSLARIDASEHSTHMHATTNWKRRWRSCRETASIHV